MSRVDELRARLRTPVEPGMRAAFDQAAAARGAVERAWPFNGSLLTDPRVEAALLSAQGMPDDERLGPGQVHGHATADLGLVSGAFLLWPATAHPLDPADLNTDQIERIARDTAPPNLDRADCARCGREGCTAAALLPVVPKLVALTFCAGCSTYLSVNHGPVRWTLPYEESK